MKLPKGLFNKFHMKRPLAYNPLFVEVDHHPLKETQKHQRQLQLLIQSANERKNIRAMT